MCTKASARDRGFRGSGLVLFSEEERMKKFTQLLTVILMTLMISAAVIAQATGSISGVVNDSNGAAIPNATVVVKGQSGQEYTVTTDSNGSYRVPGLSVGLYTVTTTVANFKKSVINNVKVDIGTPSTANVSLEAGNISEVVEVASGGEVLQTETATVGTNISGRQINQTPIASRDALDLILRLPGVSSVGAPRQSSVNGLPKGAIQLTIDGVDVQDNVLRSSDGFFTFVRPRVDAIEEVVVSTASPGAESTGDGAVQVRFATKRGTNRYTGTAYWQVRNTWLNAAYWYNNRDFLTDGVNRINGKANRDVSKLNQPGFAIGGPIPYINFGEGVKAFKSGKDRLFFFTNYEEFRLPGSQSRTRTVLTQDARNGIYKYIQNGTVQQVNLFQIAAANGQVSTIDPTVANVLSEIAASTTGGSLRNIVNAAGAVTDPNRQLFDFQNPGDAVRKFFVLRLDANIGKNHSAEYVMNRQNFLPSIDFINGQDAPFPGGPSYGQGGVRKSWAYAFKSTFGQSVSNELRYAISGGGTDFAQGCCANDYASQGGRLLDIGGAAGITNLRTVTNPNGRTTPTYDLTDNVTYVTGKHTFSFGGQAKTIRWENYSQVCCPTVSFGIDQTNEATAYNMFNSVLPASEQAGARALYAALTGRIIGFAQTAVLTANGTFVPGGSSTSIYEQKTYGLYAQDNWKLRQNLSVTLGLRWQPRMGVTAGTGNLTKLENGSRSLYGTSGGPEAQFRPGSPATAGVPRTLGLAIGEKISPDDLNNWAPSFGFVYSPNFGDKGLMRLLFGGDSKSVFRGGWSRSFVREGLNVASQVAAGNPGGASLNVGRTTANGALTYGTLLRTPNNPNLIPNQTQTTPSFPFTTTISNQIFAYSEDTQTGYVDSFNFGLQRELDKNTVIELRYVGNRGKKLERLRNVNDRNIIENGVYSEFILAQQNLYANIAANRCQAGVTTANCQYNFAYFGPGTGTSPLPISLAYFNASGAAATLTAGALGQNGTVTSAASLVPGNYSSANFRSTTYTSPMNRVAANPTTFAANIEGVAAQRANALANGLPSNFMFVNPTNTGGAFILDNTSNTWYDSGVIEVRRRLSHGLRVQASYVFSKAQGDAFAVSSIVNSSFSNRDIGLGLAKTVQPFDITHNFKLDATYDLPFGRGRQFLGGANRWVNALVGGFSILPVISWQSGSPIQIGNAQLVGMTVKELQKEVRVRKNANSVTWLPDDIIENSIRAFNTNVQVAGGYATTGTFTGAPTGRFIAPAGYNNCLANIPGTCGFNNVVIYGPTFFKLDVGINKRFEIRERFNIELRANMLDALNHPNFKVGGFAANTTGSGCCTSTFGQLASGSAYRDNNTTNDPGGRVIDLQLRVNW
jgi:hypothetical protein